MRFLHTSDWHLGHSLHGRSRDPEHGVLLAWLLDQISLHRVDALIIPGDIFDSANPPAAASKAWYDFLATARRRHPNLDIVVAGGNHDSAARLDAPGTLLRSLDVFVVGGVPRTADGAIDHEAMCIPLTDADGEIAAWVAAVPFLRPADLPRVPVTPEQDPLVEGVAQVYADTFAAVRARMEPGQAIIATGHCYMRGGRLSEDSERKVLGGNQHALPVEIFPRDAAYVALGHLHLAQKVGEADHVRYCGSPLPLSMAEREYPHQVVLVDLVDGEVEGIQTVRTPTLVEMMRLPAAGYEPLASVRQHIDALPEIDPEVPEWRRPFVEIGIRLDQPQPGLRQTIEAALEGKHARLARLVVDRPGEGFALADAVPDAELTTLTAEDVFRRRWAQRHDGEPPAALLEAFHELLQAVEQEDG